MSVSVTDVLAIDRELVSDLLTGFVKDEVHKVGFGDVVIGLSGGVDSALTTAISVRALGAEHVTVVIMPYRGSSPASQEDAQTVCDAFGLTPLVIDISPQIDAYFDRYPDADRARRGNKMARERMSILYDLSLARSALVAGTSNKTEMLLGYSTIYGDMAYALNPLGDLFKTQVWSLSEYLGVPEKIVSKVPTADLWEGQSDEAEIGYTYAEIDALLFSMVDERCTPQELLEMGFAQRMIDDVSRRVRNSQYKRRPPLIAKLGPRTIDRDFRYPRDWGR